MLDVIDDERVLDRVQTTGRVLRAALVAAAAGRPEVGDVRGIGLAWGVEFVSDPATRRPDGARASEVRDRMRRLGVLVGTTGRHGHVLKIRPPLALTETDVPTLAHALEAALSAERE